MILITGAGGKTGHAIIKALAKDNIPVNALVRHADQVEPLKSLGASQVSVGNMLDPVFINNIFKDVHSIYHISPNMSPDEVSMAELSINAARSAGVEHFVYHSVLHPQAERMPHHWQKMRVEERLFTSGLLFTILQPAPYMQNITGYWDKIVSMGDYAIPYAIQTRLSMVDLEDVAEAAVKILTEINHTGSIYELSGPDVLTQQEIAQIISKVLSHEVKARALDRKDWENTARQNQLSEYSIDTLLKMFKYYEDFGLVGSSQVLSWILSRPPHRFYEFVSNLVNGDGVYGQKKEPGI